LGGLDIDTAGLARLEERALAGVIGGRYRSESKAGVAGVRGVTDTMAHRLVTAGIKTATDLANTERTTLATLLDISETEANELVVNATATSGTFALLARHLGLSDENITALRDQGITSTGDLARADRATLGTVLGDATLGDRLAHVTGRIIGGR
jgi:predicted RecB family nuclease